MRNSPARRPTATIGHVHQEDRAPVEVLEQEPAGERVRARRRRRRSPSRSRSPSGRSSAGKMLVMIDSVAGMMSAAPTPISAWLAINWSGRADERRDRGSDAEHEEPDLQRRPAPVLVAEAAHGEQQPGERERVGVDHPLQLAVRRVQLRERSSGSATFRTELSSTRTSMLKEHADDPPRDAHRPGRSGLHRGGGGATPHTPWFVPCARGYRRLQAAGVSDDRRGDGVGARSQVLVPVADGAGVSDH